MQTLYFEDLCRICLDRKPAQHNIFERRLEESICADVDLLSTVDYDRQDVTEDFGDLCVGDALHLITTLEFAPDDELPAGICGRCEQRVLSAFLLRQHVERSYQSLIEMRQNFQAYEEPAAGSIDDTVLAERAPKAKRRKQQPNQDAKESRKSSEVNTFAIRFMPDSDEVHLIDADEAPESTAGEHLLELSAELQEEEQEEVADEEEEEEEDGVSFLLANSVPAAAAAAAAANDDDADRRQAKGAPATRAAARARHSCEMCDKTFSRKSNLIDHLRLHANIRPYVCEECGKSFVQTGNLRAHMRVHTKERPFECDICGKTYNQSGALKVHLRAHTNERDFKCEVCGKAFTNSTDRNKHAKVHDTAAHWRCERCPGRTFAQRINYALHMRKHHGVVVASVEAEKRRAKLGAKRGKRGNEAEEEVAVADILD